MRLRQACKIHPRLRRVIRCSGDDAASELYFALVHGSSIFVISVVTTDSLLACLLKDHFLSLLTSFWCDTVLRSPA